MKKLENLSKTELSEIAATIGEAFVSNDLFWSFGSIEERKNLVLKYMDIYVKATYKMGALYVNSDNSGYIGLSSGTQKFIFIKINMMLQILHILPFSIMKKFLTHIKQIENGDSIYKQKPCIEVLMVCVKKSEQGKGKMKELVDFAKEISDKSKIPCLVNTDMAEYAKKYQHYGFHLYNQITAQNGITRYNLVYKK